MPANADVNEATLPKWVGLGGLDLYAHARRGGRGVHHNIPDGGPEREWKDWAL